MNSSFLNSSKQVTPWSWKKHNSFLNFVFILLSVHLVPCSCKFLSFTKSRVGPDRRMSAEKLTLSKLWCWRRLLRVPWPARSNQSILKEINPNIHWKDQCWSSNTLATWYEEQVHWKRPWCWERLSSRGKGGDREWDGRIASLNQWTWVGANSRT